MKVPRIEDSDEIVRKQIEEASQQLRNEAGPLGLRTSYSLLEGNTSHRFRKKFVMSSFEYYSGATDPIQHL